MKEIKENLNQERYLMFIDRSNIKISVLNFIDSINLNKNFSVLFCGCHKQILKFI